MTTKTTIDSLPPLAREAYVYLREQLQRTLNDVDELFTTDGEKWASPYNPSAEETHQYALMMTNSSIRNALNTARVFYDNFGGMLYMRNEYENALYRYLRGKWLIEDVIDYDDVNPRVVVISTQGKTRRTLVWTPVGWAPLPRIKG